MPSVRLLLVVLLALVLAARLAVFFHVAAGFPDSMLTPDSPTYEQPAQALLQWGRFAQSPAAPDTPDTLRTPGYPLFIALVEALAGPSHNAVIAAQILLGMGTFLVLYACARRIWRRRTAALLAVALLALDPVSFHHSQLLLSETLFTLVLVCGLYCGCRVARHGARRPGWVLLLGLALAAAAHVRPIAYYLVLPMAFWLLLTLRRRGSGWRQALAWTLAGALPWVALVGGWQARNLLVSGRTQFSQIENVNLYLYRAADVLALREGVPFATMKQQLESRAAREMQGASPIERYDYYRREAGAILRAHPGLALRSMARGWLMMMIVPGAVHGYMYLGHPLTWPGPMSDALRLAPGAYIRKWVLGHPLLMILLLIDGFFFLSAYAGLPAMLWIDRRRIRARWPLHALTLGTLVYLMVLSAGPEAYERLRVPLVPILALYAGAFLQRAGAAVRCRCSRRGSR